MRYLVDAQLPPALARFLVVEGRDAEHVFDLKLIGNDDASIWSYATIMGSVIITKDDDFVKRSHMVSNAPPIVWIRVGNTSKRALLVWFRTILPAIETSLTRGDRIIEVM